MPKQSDDEPFVPDEETLLDDVLSDTPPGADVAEGSQEPAGELPADELVGATTDDVASLKAELDQACLRALRSQAELENYRKRAQRTLEEERRFASLPLLRDLLGVVDNLRRAIDAAQQSENAAGLLDGVKMVLEQLTGIFQRYHCEEIQAEGTPFDPHFHEAIAQFPSDKYEPGVVAQVTQTGYQLHGRVIRPSQVIVAAPKPDAPETPE